MADENEIECRPMSAFWQLYPRFWFDFDIIKFRLPNGTKVIQFCGAIVYVNQYDGRETGSSYNFGLTADRNVISNVTTMF